jgi:hypothetical protein
MSGKTIVHHLESWPIVVSNIYGEEHSEETLRDAYASWTEFMVRGPHVLILDMTQGTAGATAAQRARVAAWIEENDALLRGRRQLAHILIFDSAVMRGIVTAVFWLRPPANPHYAARNIDEAVDIAIKCLRQHGVEVSAAKVDAARRAGSGRHQTLREKAAGG